MKEEKRDYTVKIRLSKQELEVLDNYCKRYGKNRSELIRWSVFEKKLDITIGKVERDSLLDELLVSLSKIGNNMNQIAKHYNSGQIVNQNTEEILAGQLAILNKVEKMIQKQIVKLG